MTNDRVLYSKKFEEIEVNNKDQESRVFFKEVINQKKGLLSSRNNFRQLITKGKNILHRNNIPVTYVIYMKKIKNTFHTTELFVNPLIVEDLKESKQKT